MLDETAVYELQQLCTGGGLTQDSLSRLIDAGLSVQSLVRSDAAAMAQAKKAGLGMAERQALKEGLRQHRDEVLSSEEPRIVEVGDDAEAHHIVAAQLRLTEELQRRRAHEMEEAKGVEVVKNGAARERYRWTQELPEVTVSVELPPGTSKGQVLCRIGMQSLVVGVRGLPPIVHGALHARVRPEECLWQLQDSHRLLITLPKLSVAAHECSTSGGHEWWPRLLQGEPEIDVEACEAGEAANLFSGATHRLRLQKVELPERRGDKPFSKEEAERAWKDFFVKFPEMRAYELNLEAKDGKSAEEQLQEALEPLLRPQGEWEKPTDG